jgi:hypothetical protein
MSRKSPKSPAIAELESLLRDSKLSHREIARRLNVSRRTVAAAAERLHGKTAKAPPKYRLHRPRGVAFMEVGGRRFYLGPYGSAESKQAYYAKLAELAATPADNTAAYPAQQIETTASDFVIDGMIVDQLLWRFWQWAERRYRTEDGPGAHLDNLQQAVKRLTKDFGRTLVSDFGPSQLKALRDKMIEEDCSRSYVNKLTAYVKQIFNWGMEEEIVPELVAFRVAKVRSLKAGHSGAREANPVGPVPDAWVEPVYDFVSPPVRAMMKLQRLTGMRSDNVTAMRACDLEMRGEVWIYAPRRHKTSYLGHKLQIALGGRAQEIIKPYLTTDLTAYLFQPADAAAWRAKVAAELSTELEKRNAKIREAFIAGETNAAALAARFGTSRANIYVILKPLRKKAKSPKNRGETTVSKRNGTKRKERRPRYDRNTYYQAICYGIASANRARKAELEKKLERSPTELEIAAVEIPHWHPHQLRHSLSTEVRKKFGLEAAQVALSHRDRRTTERYAKLDGAEALRIAKEIG